MRRVKRYVSQGIPSATPGIRKGPGAISRAIVQGRELFTVRYLLSQEHAQRACRFIEAKQPRISVNTPPNLPPWLRSKLIELRVVKEGVSKLGDTQSTILMHT